MTLFYYEQHSFTIVMSDDKKYHNKYCSPKLQKMSERVFDLLLNLKKYETLKRFLLTCLHQLD